MVISCLSVFGERSAAFQITIFLARSWVVNAAAITGFKWSSFRPQRDNCVRRGL